MRVRPRTGFARLIDVAPIESASSWDTSLGSTSRKASTLVWQLQRRRPRVHRKGSCSQDRIGAKPIKTAFTDILNQHVAEQAAWNESRQGCPLRWKRRYCRRSTRGLGEFTLPGLLKITALSIPAKKKRFGKDPFSGEERWFAAKPASIKIKTRALKKLKDAAL